MNTGIYFNGKVYYRTPMVDSLSEGAQSIGGLEVYELLNIHDWWADPCQEVLFEVVNGRAFVRGLGDKKPFDYAKKYCTKLC